MTKNKVMKYYTKEIDHGKTVKCFHRCSHTLNGHPCPLRMFPVSLSAPGRMLSLSFQKMNVILLYRFLEVYCMQHFLFLFLVRRLIVFLKIFNQNGVFFLEALVEYFLSLSPPLVQNPEETRIPFVVGCFALNIFPLCGIQNLLLHQPVENGSQDSWQSCFQSPLVFLEKVFVDS